MKLILKNLTVSVFVIFRAIKYIVIRPKLYPLVLAPIIINLGLALILIYFGFSSLEGLIDIALQNEFFQEFGFINGILKVLSLIILIIVGLWMFIVMGMIISAPFNGLLAEHILDTYNVHQVKSYTGLPLIIWEIIRAIKFEFAKLFLSLIILIVTFIINLIPVIGPTLFTIINLVFSGFINLIDLYDTSYSRRELTFREKSFVTFRNWDLNTPFGLLNTFLINLPLVNFFYIPFGITAATLLFIESEKE